MNCIEIFSGAGGLAKGLEMAGANQCAFVEWDHNACTTLRHNFNPSLVFEGDVRNFPFSDYTDIDIIAGGPPCQPFSLGGKAAGNNDSRNMFPSAISAIRQVMPKAFIFENVKGLLRPSFSDYFNYILLQLSYPSICLGSDDWRQNLEKLKALHHSKTHLSDYQVNYYLVNAADYGVAQTRERIFIVGIRSDLGIHYSFPKPTHSKDALLWNMYVTGTYWHQFGLTNQQDTEEGKSYRKNLLDKYGMMAPASHPWLTIRNVIYDLGKPTSSGEHTIRSGAKTYPGHTGSFIDWPSKTIKAGTHGVPGGENMVRFDKDNVRYLTVAEAKRIQSFPDNYHIFGSWTEAMRQLGNAVPVNLAKIVGSSVIKSIRKVQEEKSAI